MPRESSRVLALGLDAADLALMERWCAAGKLPELNAVLRAGALGRTLSRDGYTAETPWTTFLTGCWPETTGYWSPARYFPDYRVEDRGAYNYERWGPFYDFCGSKPVVIFDVPQVRPSKKVNGVQVLGWGAHSPQGPSQSAPASALEVLTARYGPHPALHKDDLLVWEGVRQRSKFLTRLRQGIVRRTRATLHLMAEAPWDLFFVVFGECHSAGHGLWHLSQSDHPLYPLYAREGEDPLLEIYQALDEAVGEIRRHLPADCYFVVFSQEGMKANATDLPSWLFLPEILHRMSFDGRAALAKGHSGIAPSPLSRQRQIEWLRALWAEREGTSSLARFIRRTSRLRITRMTDRRLELQPGLRHPLDTPVLSYMPQLWYQPLWPHMKAFALPSFSEGYVRLNVRGRERQGLVAPRDFAQTCEDIVGLVARLVDARSGRPILRDVLRQRAGPHDNAAGPDADLIFLWQPEPTDVIDSPYGRIGPIPYRRSGDHHGQGFFVVMGPDVSPCRLAPGPLIDVAPTLLDLLGVTPPNHLDGTSRRAEILHHASAA